MLCLSVLLFLAGSVSAQQFSCPDDGYYMDPVQCDKYYDCYRGTSVEKLCPDGLVFDNSQSPRVGQCTYPFLVECPPNYTLQPAQPTAACPRQNGIFQHEDIHNCRSYYECANGIDTEYACPSGLVFDEYSGTCVWERSGLRAECHQTRVTLSDGFKCPDVNQVATNGHETFHELHPKLDDCRSFYICFGGETPREGGCPEGQVFNDLSLVCDSPLNVPGCENYYGDGNDLI
ncbi:obstructor-A [Oratosquilla oratoria]|uniref:obstructor-A n=1 Tax=Oratosquilla oratoria TaxID=337810 RepID=UPI003F766477